MGLERQGEERFDMSNVYQSISPSPPLLSSILAWCRDGMVPRERDDHMHIMCGNGGHSPSPITPLM